jgi:urea carboxylase
MIYEEPAFRILGDTTLNVEFGDETSIPLNFRILTLDRAIRANPLNGLIETNPQVRTLGIVYNPLVTSHGKLRAYVKDLLASETDVKTLPSRRVTIPALYNDPWSRECAAAFGVQNNIEYIADLNRLTVSEVVALHTGSDYWVTGVGFVPGAFMSYAMDPRKKFGAPLYRTPRTWTHSRLLNFGGNTSTIYPFRTPGGGQLFGRTPINIFEPKQKNRAFANGPVLAHAGDRHRYVSITQEEYYEIRAAVENGSYDYAIEDDVFDVAGYQDWLRQLEATDPVGLTRTKA